MTKASADAKVLQILLWYDQAEIVLLQASPLEYILAVSSAHADNEDGVFVGAGMTFSRIEEYQEGKFDLRYAMAHANLRKYYTFYFDGLSDSVSLTRITRTSEIITASLPDSGFFSREHHDIKLVQHRIPDAREQFDVDGGWELGEFSKFYNQVEDIYYMFNDMNLFNNPNTPFSTKSTIQKAFDRSWGGGGSYVAFYDKIANDNSHVAPLRVSGIQYNSPGYVAVRAKKKPFEDMIALLQAYADNGLEIRKAFNALDKFMSFSGMLKPDSKIVALTPVMSEELTNLSDNLATLLPGIEFKDLTKMAGNDIIVSSKVLKSVVRRVSKLYAFFEQGRVKYDGLDTTPLVNED
jgi:hypothetical protein